MKICGIIEFFVPHYWGGGEVRFYEILKRLAKEGHEVHLVCMRLKNVKNEQIYEGIHIHRIGPVIEKPPVRTPLQLIHFAISVFWLLINNKYDTVDAQAFIPLLPASFVHMLGIQKNVIGTIHDVSDYGKKDQWIQHGGIAHYLEKFLYSLPLKKVITVSSATKKSLVKAYGRKPNNITVVHNGADIELIDSVKAGVEIPNSVVFVGRIIPHKHVDDLLNVGAEIIKQMPDFKLHVVGDGGELKNLKQLAKKLGINKNVTFYGKLKTYKDMIAVIKQCSMLVLPSTREGFGMVLAEANACYKPVIAYKSGGVVDVIQDGVNGYLVPERNLFMLKDKIMNILQDYKLAKKMGDNGRKITVDSFTWDKATLKIWKVYKK